MSNANACWICVADEGKGSLLRIEPAPVTSHPPRVERLDEFKSEPLEHQQGRPSPRHGKNAHTYASPGHERDETLRRSASVIGRWIEERIERHGIERLHVFAAPRLLGSLRKVASPGVWSHVEAHEGDLCNVPAPDLATHPEIATLL